MVHTIPIIVLLYLAWPPCDVWYYTSAIHRQDNYCMWRRQQSATPTASRAGGSTFLLSVLRAVCHACAPRAVCHAWLAFKLIFIGPELSKFFWSGVFCFVRERPPLPWCAPPQRHTSTHHTQQIVCMYDDKTKVRSVGHYDLRCVPRVRCVSCAARIRRVPCVTRGMLSNLCSWSGAFIQNFFFGRESCFVRKKPSPWAPPQRYSRYNTSYISYHVLCRHKINRWLRVSPKQNHAHLYDYATHIEIIPPRASTWST